MADVKTRSLTPDLANISSLIAAESSIEPADSISSTYPDATLFSFLPELYLIITRLRELRDPQPPDPLDEHDLTQTISRDSTRITTDSNAEPLEVREISAAVYTVRRGITAAKDIVRNLPDGNRNTIEQNREIRKLEKAIEALKTRLEHVGRIAATGNRDVEMTGT